MVLELFVFLAAVLIVLTVVTQVIVPGISGEPMFPLLRTSAVKVEITKAEKELETLAEAAHLKNVATEVERRKAELEKK